MMGRLDWKMETMTMRGGYRSAITIPGELFVTMAGGLKRRWSFAVSWDSLQMVSSYRKQGFSNGITFLYFEPLTHTQVAIFTLYE